MKIEILELRRIADLAKIKIEDSDADKFKNELSGIINWLNQLNDFSLEETDINVHRKEIVIERDDDSPTPDQHEMILANAPKKIHNFFVVPKVVE